MGRPHRRSHAPLATSPASRAGATPAYDAVGNSGALERLPEAEPERESDLLGEDAGGGLATAPRPPDAPPGDSGDGSVVTSPTVVVDDSVVTSPIIAVSDPAVRTLPPPVVVEDAAIRPSRTVVVDDPAEAKKLTHVDEDTTTSAEGTRTSSKAHGQREESADGAAMGRTLRADLEEQSLQLRAGMARATRDGDADLSKSLGDEFAEVERGLGELDAFGEVPSPAQVRSVAHSTGVEIDDELAIVASDVVTDSTAIDMNPLSTGIGVDTSRSVEAPRGEVQTTETTSTRLTGEGLSRTHSTKAAEEEPDGDQVTSTTSDRSTLTMDKGVGLARTHSYGSKHVDAEGEVESESSSSSTSSGGAILGDELGVRLGSSDKRSSKHRVEDEDGSAHVDGSEVTSSVDGSISTGGVSLSGTTDRRVSHGDWNGGTKTSADGSFTIEVVPVDDREPPTYRMTFKLHVGGSVGGTVGHGESGDKAHGELGLTATGAGELSYTRSLSLAEAQRYMEEADRVDRGLDPDASLPEFGRLARLRACADEAASGKLGGLEALTGDASAAAGLGDGESVSLMLEGGLTGSASGGGTVGGVGLEGEASAGRTLRRRLTLERTTDPQTHEPRVSVVVRFEAVDTLSGGVGGSLEVSAAVGTESTSKDVDEVSFLLDPDSTEYDALYGEIVSTASGSVDSLRSLAQQERMQDHVARVRHQDDEEGKDHYDVGFGATRLRVLDGQAHRETVDRGRDQKTGDMRLSGKVEGEHEGGLSLRHGKDTLASWGRKDAVEGAVDQEGAIDLTLTTTESATDAPLRAIRDGTKDIREADGALETAEAVASQSPLHRLREVLAHSYSDLSGYELTNAHVDRVIERAADQGNWSWCCGHPGAIEAWNTLGRRLRAPVVDPAEADIDRRVAVSLARVRSIAAFMEQHGADAMDCMEHVLRRWGEHGNTVSTAEDIGTMFEWPSELGDVHERYDRLVRRVEGLAGQLRAFSASPDGLASANACANPILLDLQVVSDEVRRSGHFESERARSELLMTIASQRTDARRALAQFQVTWRAGALRSGEGVSGEDGAAAMSVYAPPGVVEDPEVVVARGSVRDLQRQMSSNKAHENRKFDEIREHLSGTVLGTFLNTDRSDAGEIVSAIQELHQTWVTQIVDLRSAYQRAGVPESQWWVSGVRGTRRAGTEPDYTTLFRLYRRVQESCHVAPDLTEGIINQWRPLYQY